MNNLTLLCVEDDEEALNDTVYLLKKYFKKIYTAVDGDEALASYAKYQPDIILLDINIPKLNGIEVAQSIRQTDETTPIIFLSAHSDRDKLLCAIKIQVSSYIVKPFEVKELNDTIAKTIQRILKNNIVLTLNSGFSWDKDTHDLYYDKTKIPLTKNEIVLVQLLLAQRPRYLSVNEIALEIGENNSDVHSNNIVQLISRFKKKIKNIIQSDVCFIENTYGSGYRIL
ncbi:MAG: response regulator transcription factor [Campylobacterota bacterium]|nr:response regulator transcription factor [Campylobacterota bacterium]